MTERRQRSTGARKKSSQTPASSSGHAQRKTVSVPTGEVAPDDTASLDDGRAQLQAFVEANEAIMASMATLGSEMAAFGTKRLNENIERNHLLLGCRDPEEILRIHSQFIEAATQQYIDQVSTVMNIVNEMATAIWAPLGAVSEVGREVKGGEEK